MKPNPLPATIANLNHHNPQGTKPYMAKQQNNSSSSASELPSERSDFPKISAGADLVHVIPSPGEYAKSPGERVDSYPLASRMVSSPVVLHKPSSPWAQIIRTVLAAITTTVVFASEVSRKFLKKIARRFILGSGKAKSESNLTKEFAVAKTKKTGMAATSAKPYDNDFSPAEQQKATVSHPESPIFAEPTIIPDETINPGSDISHEQEEDETSHETADQSDQDNNNAAITTVSAQALPESVDPSKTPAATADIIESGDIVPTGISAGSAPAIRYSMTKSSILVVKLDSPYM